MSILPSINACLNSVTAILLVLGYWMIRRRAVTAHKICMITASFTSAVFLACYLYYHYHHGSTKFPGVGAVRTLYFTILISHTLLAALQLPLILLTLYRAFRGELQKHVTLARITLPIWLYVSLTGVVIYWMLYRMRWT